MGKFLDPASHDAWLEEQKRLTEARRQHWHEEIERRTEACRKSGRVLQAAQNRLNQAHKALDEAPWWKKDKARREYWEAQALYGKASADHDDVSRDVSRARDQLYSLH